MKAGEDGEEEGVLAASLTSHPQRVLWLWFPKKRLHANLCLLIRTIHRSESIQVWLKARRKRKRKDKILLNCKRSCRNLSFWDVQMSVRVFKMNWQKISSMVLRWTQAFTLRSVNGSQRHSKGSLEFTMEIVILPLQVWTKGGSSFWWQGWKTVTTQFCIRERGYKSAPWCYWKIIKMKNLAQ